MANCLPRAFFTDADLSAMETDWGLPPRSLRTTKTGMSYRHVFSRTAARLRRHCRRQADKLFADLTDEQGAAQLPKPHRSAGSRWRTNSSWAATSPGTPLRCALSCEARASAAPMIERRHGLIDTVALDHRPLRRWPRASTAASARCPTRGSIAPGWSARARGRRSRRGTGPERCGSRSGRCCTAALSVRCR